MEKAYWLGRTRASSQMAAKARCAEARMAHLELAGRYSIRAAMAAIPIDGPQPRALHSLSIRTPMGEMDVEATFGGAAYYERLETGARWLAGRAATATERDEHLGMANRYARLRGDTASSATVRI